MPTCTPQSLSVPCLVAAAVAAFANDPLFSYAFRPDKLGQQALHHYIKSSLNFCLANGSVVALPASDGMLAWVPQKHFPPHMAEQTPPILLESIARFEEHEQTPESIIAANGKSYGYIWLLAVHPSRQGKGMAGSLLAEAFSQMKQQGLCECWLSTENESNCSFYEHHGFTLYAKRTSTAKIETYVYRKQL